MSYLAKVKAFAKKNPDVATLMGIVSCAFVLGGTAAIHTARTNPEVVIDKSRQRPFLSPEEYNVPKTQENR
jgi:hypothetical protein